MKNMTLIRRQTFPQKWSRRFVYNLRREVRQAVRLRVTRLVPTKLVFILAIQVKLILYIGLL